MRFALLYSLYTPLPSTHSLPYPTIKSKMDSIEKYGKISLALTTLEVYKMNNYEYLKFYWNYIDEETPVVIFYEIDLDNERYATRMTEVFHNRTSVPVIEPGFPFITEAPVPTVEEINQEDDFFAELISKEEFEEAYHGKHYFGTIQFPLNKR